MRYLYGDSVPFPPQYDFLAALEAFCTHAARIVRLDAECTALRRASEETAVQRAKAAEELEAFHKEAIGAVQEGAKDSTQTLVHDYAQQLGDLAASIAENARRSAIMASDRDAQTTRAECDKRKIETRDALEKLMAAVRIPVSETQITMSLVEGRNDFAATFTHEGGLLASFTLAGGEVDDWKAPRHVRDLAQGVALPVGVKRSLFKRTVAAETIPLDEYVISGFDLRDERAELRLRKRAQDLDSIVFTLRRIEDRLVAEVHHPDDAEAESGLPTVMDQSSAAEVEKVWQLLRQACAPVLAKKKRLVKLALAGDDVFESNLGTQVVGLVVGVIAPVVSEVARRSPNQHELSLKVENDTGRREEIYLRKAQLVSALASVTPKARRVFDPLGLIASDPRETIESLTDEAILAE
jgi:histone H3/H4